MHEAPLEVRMNRWWPLGSFPVPKLARDLETSNAATQAGKGYRPPTRTSTVCPRLNICRQASSCEGGIAESPSYGAPKAIFATSSKDVPRTRGPSHMTLVKPSVVER